MLHVYLVGARSFFFGAISRKGHLLRLNPDCGSNHISSFLTNLNIFYQIDILRYVMCVLPNDVEMILLNSTSKVA